MKGLRNTGIVYRKELLDSLRDRRTIISMIVVPLLVMPVVSLLTQPPGPELISKAFGEEAVTGKPQDGG